MEPQKPLNDRQLLRYSGHIMLPQLGYEGQQRLLAARVLLIGLGGLGSSVAMYLAAAGVGHLVLVDFDEVALSNLQRQILHGETDLDQPKVVSAKTTLQAMHPDCKITAIPEKIAGKLLEEEVEKADLVIDASDNFATRFAINAACVRKHTPLVSGAAIRWEGQVTVFSNQTEDAPCYRCLYPDTEAAEVPACSEAGVLGPLVGVVGSLQAVEAIKLLSDCGNALIGRVLMMDLNSMEWRSLKLNKDPHCEVCGKIYG